VAGRQLALESPQLAQARQRLAAEPRYCVRLPPFRWPRRLRPIRNDDDGGVRDGDGAGRDDDDVRQVPGVRKPDRPLRLLRALLSVSCSCFPSLSVIVDNMVRETSFENLTKYFDMM
jgi:hypothetical protein